MLNIRQRIWLSRLTRVYFTLLFILVSSSGKPVFASRRIPVPKDATIRGTIIVNGCQVKPRAISLLAQPIESVASFDSIPKRQNNIQRKARQSWANIRSTANAHQFSFAISKTKPGVFYKLFIGIWEETCGKVFWRGSDAGFVPAGSNRVLIEGFAVTTEIELFDPTLDNWVGADHLDFTDSTAAIRSLRWRSSLPAVQSGELQLSVEPFPISGDFGSCDENEGSVIYRKSLPSLEIREWQVIPDINFKEILAPSRAGLRRTSNGGVTSEVNEGIFKRLNAGSPIYLRVVPTTNGRAACNISNDGVPGWVIAAKLPGLKELEDPPSIPSPEIEASKNQSYLPPKIDGGASTGHPTASELAYKSVKPHKLPPKKCFLGTMSEKQFKYYFYNDPLGCLLVNHDLAVPGSEFPKGKWFWFTPKTGSSGSSNPLSAFGDTLVGLGTGLFGAVGGAVNFLHELSMEIENTIAGVIVDIITVVDVLDGCSALKNAGLSCKSLVKAGLKAGLASMGVPPVSIPNWEQIQSQGFDYLAGAMANEIANATGIPPELTQEKLKELVETATNKAIEEITKKRQISSLSSYDWVIPYAGYDPAIWFMKLKNNSVDGLPPTMRFIRKDNELYLGANILVPEFFPTSNELTIPSVLPINISSLPVPICKTNRYLQTTCTPNPFLKTARCEFESYQPKGANDSKPYKWIETKCEGINGLNIYYRDKWIESFKSSTQCMSLWGNLFTTSGDLYISFPAPPLVQFALIKPQQWFTWDGPVFFSSGCP